MRNNRTTKTVDNQQETKLYGEEQIMRNKRTKETDENQ
jgi:hypothetical protein